VHSAQPVQQLPAVPHSCDVLTQDVREALVNFVSGRAHVRKRQHTRVPAEQKRSQQLLIIIISGGSLASAGFYLCWWRSQVLGFTV
jgi:hypothetical protein